MNQNNRDPERVGGHGSLNGQGNNPETPLLGRHVDEDSTPLLQHNCIFIRAPARAAHTLRQEMAESPGKVAVSVLLLVGISLAFFAATSRVFNPVLVIAAAVLFIFCAITYRAMLVQSWRSST
jgi:hypothetical protein